jgi:hypothetical protein
MGIIVMAAISVVAFQRARKTGRNPAMWVAMVWIVGLAVGFACACVGAIFDSGVFPTFALWGMVAGNTIGSGWIAVRAGRNPISN